MKEFRLCAIVIAGALLFASGCGQKPATTEAVPAPATEPPAAAAPESPTRERTPEQRAAAEKRAEERRRERPAEPSPLTPGGERTAPRVTSLTLPAGTEIRVRTTTVLSTKTAQTGDSFTANLMDDLVQDGITVAPRGATVRGTVVESDPGGRVKGKAQISVRLTELDVNGKAVPLATDAIGREAAGTVKKDALKIGIGSGIGAAIGAIAGGGKGAAIGAAAGGGAGGAYVLGTRGDPAVIGSETPLTFHLTAPARVR